jgi:hypothetical protein
MQALALSRPGLLTLLLSVLWMRCALPVVAAAASSPAQSFKLQDHLATKVQAAAAAAAAAYTVQARPPTCATAALAQAPYTHRLRAQGAPYLHELPDPPGYEPIFLWLLSRHGSRWCVSPFGCLAGGGGEGLTSRCMHASSHALSVRLAYAGRQQQVVHTCHAAMDACSRASSAHTPVWPAVPDFRH